VADHFEAIYGCDYMGDVCKPEQARTWDWGRIACAAMHAYKSIDRSIHPSVRPPHLPQQAAFEKVLAALPPRAHTGEGSRDVGPPHDDVVFFEDSFKNLMAGRALGMRTVLIRKSVVLAR
jgi:FMN phosphatase YigB (HAD superfamily)